MLCVKQQILEGCLFLGGLFFSIFLACGAWAGDNFKAFSPVEVNGFLELRAGCRVRDDPRQKQASVMESRLQAELFTYAPWAEFKYKADVWADGITEKGEYDTRESWMFARPSDVLDVKIGRQVLTWGTGDLVFLNDLFPKDWQSYFIGRDSEYLKAPSDALKVSCFTSLANIDLVYTPQFDPDRYITGAYVSYWNGSELAGRDSLTGAQVPDQWFKDDEIALRLYKNIYNYELALYGYRGFWKRPAGQSDSGEHLFFPELSVYGFSARGRVGRGIGNLEFAYYRSGQDSDGTNPEINNSELRYLAGYNQDLARDFNASLQYYVEQILHYDEYENSLVQGPARDRFRHVITLQLTWLLMNQNLELSLASYLCPSDRDAYLRPSAAYKWTDDIIVEAGANIFTGREMHTFFGQFEDNTNVYTAVRFSF